MRHTLRNPSPEQEDKDEGVAKRGRRHWRRHPNMHHEGDRKRWRDKVTERERKRYEGVWAGNRGVLVDRDLEYIDFDGASELVINVVVKDIWERSRLPRTCWKRSGTWSPRPTQRPSTAKSSSSACG